MVIVQEIRKGFLPDQEGGVVSGILARRLGKHQADFRKTGEKPIRGSDRTHVDIVIQNRMSVQSSATPSASQPARASQLYAVST